MLKAALVLMLILPFAVEAKPKTVKKRRTTNHAVKYQGEFRVELRQFEDDEDTSTQDVGQAIYNRIELKHKWRKLRKWTNEVSLFYRIDQRDSSRDLVVIEQFKTGRTWGDFDLSVGTQLLNWSATEAFHPADVLNSRNFDSDFENAEKIGEPMIRAAYYFKEINFQLMYMPLFTPPKLPQGSNRLSFAPPGINIGKARYIDTSGELAESEYTNQFAFRVDTSFDNADLSLHYLSHVDRYHPLVTVLSGAVTPLYLPMNQLGGTYQHVLGSWVFKAEFAQKQFLKIKETGLSQLEQKDHSQLALGLDFGWASSGGKDFTLILEAQRYLGVDENERAGLGIFQNDMLLGFRLAFNNADSSELFLGFINDLERDNERMINISFKERITGNWSYQLGVRQIDAPVKDLTPVGLESLDGSNQVYLHLSRFF